MTAKPAPTQQAGGSDRRTGVDRRRVDAVPPGKVERRRNLEARKPEVIELEMSNSEWSALTQDPSAADAWPRR